MCSPPWWTAACADGAVIHGRLVAPALVGSGSEIAPGAIVGGRAVLGSGVSVGPGAHIESSVVLDGVRIGEGTMIRSSIISSAVTIGDHCHIDGGVLGEGVQLGSDNVLTAGARLFPGVELGDGPIR